MKTSVRPVRAATLVVLLFASQSLFHSALANLTADQIRVRQLNRLVLPDLERSAGVFCGLPLQRETTGFNLGASIKVELNQLLQKLGTVDAGLGAKYRTESVKEGLIAKDVLPALKVRNECYKIVFQLLEDKLLLPMPKQGNEPPPPKLDPEADRRAIIARADIQRRQNIAVEQKSSYLACRAAKRDRCPDHLSDGSDVNMPPDAFILLRRMGADLSDIGANYNIPPGAKLSWE